MLRSSFGFKKMFNIKPIQARFASELRRNTAGDAGLPDIFISYAHIDDQPFANEEKGRIPHFVNNFRDVLGRKIGRAEDYDLWKDFRLKGSDALTPVIEA